MKWLRLFNKNKEYDGYRTILIPFLSFTTGTEWVTTNKYYNIFLTTKIPDAITNIIWLNEIRYILKNNTKITQIPILVQDIKHIRVSYWFKTSDGYLEPSEIIRDISKLSLDILDMLENNTNLPTFIKDSSLTLIEETTGVLTTLSNLN